MIKIGVSLDCVLNHASKKVYQDLFFQFRILFPNHKPLNFIFIPYLEYFFYENGIWIFKIIASQSSHSSQFSHSLSPPKPLYFHKLKFISSVLPLYGSTPYSLYTWLYVIKVKCNQYYHITLMCQKWQIKT